ncbi:hypothetical protein ACFLZP_02265 [Patescibacteria group bacterium]
MKCSQAMKKTLSLLGFLILLPLDLGLCLLSLNRFGPIRELPSTRNNQPQKLSFQKNTNHVYASLPKNSGQINNTVQADDARPIIIERYLEKYHSTMKPYPEIARHIVQTSDQNGLDWRLLVAIAQQESNLGKKMPPGCNNAWGYGIHSRGTLCFQSWEEGITTVARGLKKKYLDQGLDTPEKIMAKYTPHSSGSWASGVDQFLKELQLGKL